MKSFPFILFYITFSFGLPVIVSAQISSANIYTPLAVGNNWYYKHHTSIDSVSSDITSIVKVIATDTIKDKEYFVLMVSRVKNSGIQDYIYYQRILNDTLFSLNYDYKLNQYIERIDAIFSLGISEEATIVLNIDTSKLLNKNEIEKFPGRMYKISVKEKSSGTITFFTNSGMVDGNYTTTYKKGVGLIRSKNDWGIEQELVNYEINN